LRLLFDDLGVAVNFIGDPSATCGCHRQRIRTRFVPTVCILLEGEANSNYSSFSCFLLHLTNITVRKN
jgi:hypothetical protein